jgi:Zn-dependent M28 family amino/carboxypeptidase
VVLSAHIDHIGIGEPINSDRIYNGAMDNASGSAVLLDVASSVKKSGETFKRSLLFVFVTGEEKGLLGSRYFTAYPTVDPKAMAADIVFLHKMETENMGKFLKDLVIALFAGTAFKISCKR